MWHQLPLLYGTYHYYTASFFFNLDILTFIHCKIRIILKQPFVETCISRFYPGRTHCFRYLRTMTVCKTISGVVFRSYSAWKLSTKTSKLILVCTILNLFIKLQGESRYYFCSQLHLDRNLCLITPPCTDGNIWVLIGCRTHQKVTTIWLHSPWIRKTYWPNGICSNQKRV